READPAMERTPCRHLHRGWREESEEIERCVITSLLSAPQPVIVPVGGIHFSTGRSGWFLPGKGVLWHSQIQKNPTKIQESLAK
ncbi:hypothetical protein, partial [Prevotella pectinovora]|uniref:hypothetical protein n=1 Tax=Prevotella pectinovora TaxID=1602169 RepID=UPI003A909771